MKCQTELTILLFSASRLLSSWSVDDMITEWIDHVQIGRTILSLPMCKVHVEQLLHKIDSVRNQNQFLNTSTWHGMVTYMIGNRINGME